jgi:ATP-dependent Clp protease ATP-binding subunit ClpB
LVAAAVLSDRYITGRQLPDKAIDLVDEAASRLRIEIDSMPEAIDELTRRRIQLEIEREALKKETDSVASDRLQRLEVELADVTEEVTRRLAGFYTMTIVLPWVQGLLKFRLKITAPSRTWRLR